MYLEQTFKISTHSYYYCFLNPGIVLDPPGFMNNCHKEQDICLEVQALYLGFTIIIVINAIIIIIVTVIIVYRGVVLISGDIIIIFIIIIVVVHLFTLQCTQGAVASDQ